MTRIAGAMASVELPAQQVNGLMARGVNTDAVVAVAPTQSTVIGRATQTVRDLVAAWGSATSVRWPVDSIAFTGRPDPQTNWPEAREISPPGKSPTTRRPRSTRAALLRRLLLGGRTRFAAAVQATLGAAAGSSELTPTPC